MHAHSAGAPRSQQSRAVVKYVSNVVQRSAVSQSVVREREREREREVYIAGVPQVSHREIEEKDVLESSKAVR